MRLTMSSCVKVARLALKKSGYCNRFEAVNTNASSYTISQLFQRLVQHVFGNDLLQKLRHCEQSVEHGKNTRSETHWLLPFPVVHRVETAHVPATRLDCGGTSIECFF